MASVADVLNIGAPLPVNKVKIDIGPASDRVYSSTTYHTNPMSLFIDVMVVQRQRNLGGLELEFPPTKWDDVAAALKANGGLRMAYIFGNALVGSVLLPVKLISITSDYSNGPYEPVYDVLRFAYEAGHA